MGPPGDGFLLRRRFISDLEWVWPDLGSMSQSTPPWPQEALSAFAPARWTNGAARRRLSAPSTFHFRSGMGVAGSWQHEPEHPALAPGSPQCVRTGPVDQWGRPATAFCSVDVSFPIWNGCGRILAA